MDLGCYADAVSYFPQFVVYVNQDPMASLAPHWSSIDPFARGHTSLNMSPNDRPIKRALQLLPNRSPRVTTPSLQPSRPLPPVPIIGTCIIRYWPRALLNGHRPLPRRRRAMEVRTACVPELLRFLVLPEGISPARVGMFWSFRLDIRQEISFFKL
jgi:hypothetical protein